jgi:heme exporter protein A
VNPATPEAGAIQAVGLTRRFGALVALDRVDLAVAQGECVAVFGPNGAGKTTLVRLLTLGLRPDAGRLRLAGLDPRRDERRVRQRIGVISHQCHFYDNLSPAENLGFFARLHGVPDPAGRSAELLDAVGLAHRAHDAAGGLSRGMQQRLSLARALIHDPSLVFLDEPFSGLDLHAALMLRSTLGRLHDDGCTVVLVTHDLRQGLELSDRWILLAQGRIVASGRSEATDPEGFARSYFERFGATAAGRRAGRSDAH